MIFDVKVKLKLASNYSVKIYLNNTNTELASIFEYTPDCIKNSLIRKFNLSNENIEKLLNEKELIIDGKIETSILYNNTLNRFKDELKYDCVVENTRLNLFELSLYKSKIIIRELLEFKKFNNLEELNDYIYKRFKLKVEQDIYDNFISETMLNNFIE